MTEIVHAHYGDIDKKLVEQAMEAFYSLRDMNELQKKPSTSELLDWIQALIISGVDIKKIVDEIPYVGVLLKKNEDIEVMREIKEKGYSLSAGGPIIFPQTDVMVITPICPHSLQARSLVVSGEDRIMIEIGRRRKTQREEAMVTFDGRSAQELETGDRIEIYKAQETTQLIRLKGRSFYQVLQNKIGTA